jgi:hypothetical protein
MLVAPQKKKNQKHTGSNPEPKDYKATTLLLPLHLPFFVCVCVCVLYSKPSSLLLDRPNWGV